MIPPRNKDIEDTVLGTIVTDIEAPPICLSKLTPDSFYGENVDIYLALRRDYDENGDVDYVRVENEIRKEHGEEHFLPNPMELMKMATSVDRAEEYCDILNDLAARRRGQKEMSSILADINAIDSSEMITRMEDIIHDNIETISMPGMTYSEILAREDGKEEAERLYTGDRFFDETFFADDGSRRGGVLIPFGDSGSGKTSFSVWLTARYLDQGYRGAFIIRESKDSKVADRIYKNMDKKENIENLIIADTRQGITDLSKIESTIKYHNAVRPLDFFVVDHLRIIPVKGINDWEENNKITACVNRLMYLSQEVNAFSILPSQVNRSTLSNARGWQKDPNLNNLYGSSATEQAASMAVSVFRPSKYDELIDCYPDGTPRAVKGANWNNDQVTFDINSVFVRQKKIRDGEQYPAYVRFVHGDNGLKRPTETKPF